MGKSPIEFTKQREEAGIHYYYVATHRFGNFEFFVGIDQKNNCVLFYDDKELTKLLGAIDLSKQNYWIEIAYINPNIVSRVSVECYKAIRDNKFPDYLTIYN